MHALRRWAREKDAIKHRLQEFDVHSCACFVEDDRKIVQDAIAALFTARSMVSKNATREETLQAFNEFVRCGLLGAFTSAFGWCSFAYPHYVVAAFILDVAEGLDFFTAWRDQRRWMICVMLYDISWTAMCWPCIFVLAELMASRCLRWHSWKGGVYIVLGFLFCVLIPGYLLDLGIKALEAAARTSEIALGAQCASIPIGILIGAAASAGRCPRCISRRKASTEEGGTAVAQPDVGDEAQTAAGGAIPMPPGGELASDSEMQVDGPAGAEGPQPREEPAVEEPGGATPAPVAPVASPVESNSEGSEVTI